MKFPRIFPDTNVPIKMLSKIKEDFDKLEEINDPIEIKKKLNRIRKATTELDVYLDQARLHINIANFVIAVITNLAFISFLIFQARSINHTYLHVKNDYYAAVVQLLPVMLIAIYFSDSIKPKIDGLLSALTEIISIILPTMTGILASFIVLAGINSNKLLFYATVYALANVASALVTSIILPGFVKIKR